MFSFVQVILLVAFIARTQALKCYSGLGTEKSHPPSIEVCPWITKHCFVKTGIITQYSCDYGGRICKKQGCEKVGSVTTCCCASDLCNKLDI
ncbi:unnamed protein product [Cylicocyclus nassatus]|uniref:Uncharacterized protein n=1 Tax=Cylicocyclus nassatus TaxID=53992 RepID=A0AA36M524_CYLNA|nr:unnamed protein product [Cylicocyclus nassatus]CAJ0598085.1 unnamed protein product [Cylicocyclus nassatus]